MMGFHEIYSCLFVFIRGFGPHINLHISASFPGQGLHIVSAHKKHDWTQGRFSDMGNAMKESSSERPKTGKSARIRISYWDSGPYAIPKPCKGELKVRAHCCPEYKDLRGFQKKFGNLGGLYRPRERGRPARIS